MHEKMTCEVYRSTKFVGYNGSPSTVKVTNCNKKHLNFWLWAPPTPVGRVPPYIGWGRVPSPVLCWWNWFCNFFARFTMKTVFERLCNSKMWSKSLWLVFACFVPGPLVSFDFLCGEMVRVILFCQFVHLCALLFGPANCELWFTIDLVSEESIVNTCEMFTLRVTSFAVSLPRIPGDMVLFLFFSFAVSSTMATPFLDHVLCERKCNTQFLDSKKEDIENIVLLVLFRTTRITPHYPTRGSSNSNLCWVGCWRYSAASLHEMLLDEDDFRSFWQALVLGDVLLPSQLSVTILVLWIRVTPYLFDHLQHVEVSTRNVLWIRFHIRVSPYLLGLWLHHDSLD